MDSVQTDLTFPAPRSLRFQPFAPLAWCEGRVMPLADARVPMGDRGFLFGEAVYEGILSCRRKLFAGPEHIERLARSARGIGLDPGAFLHVVERAARELTEAEEGLGFLYLQVTGGAGVRDHLPPGGDFPPAVYATLTAYDPEWLANLQSRGIAIVTERDPRWGLATYKTTQLLANIMAKRRARTRGAQEVLFVDGDGSLLEGGSTNAFFVHNGLIATPPLDRNLLPGITRLRLLEHFADMIHERSVMERELETMDEMFIASTTRPVVAVVRCNDRPVGDGSPGPLTRRLAERFWQLVEDELA